MKSKYLKELNKIFITYFNNKKILIDEKTTAKDIKNWDSLAQVALIISIERNSFEVEYRNTRKILC